MVRSKIRNCGNFLLCMLIAGWVYSVQAFDPIESLLGAYNFASDNLNQEFEYIYRHPRALLCMDHEMQYSLLSCFTRHQILLLYYDSFLVPEVQRVIQAYAGSFTMLALTHEELSAGFLEGIGILYTQLRHLVVVPSRQSAIDEQIARAIACYLPNITILDISGTRIEQIGIDILKMLPNLVKFSFSLKSMGIILEGNFTIKNLNSSKYKY